MIYQMNKSMNTVEICSNNFSQNILTFLNQEVQKPTHKTQFKNLYLLTIVTRLEECLLHIKPIFHVKKSSVCYKIAIFAVAY